MAEGVEAAKRKAAFAAVDEFVKSGSVRGEKIKYIYERWIG